MTQPLAQGDGLAYHVHRAARGMVMVVVGGSGYEDDYDDDEDDGQRARCRPSTYTCQNREEEKRARREMP
jgi:hypothetical protein